MRYLPTKSEAKIETVGDSTEIQASSYVIMVGIALEPLRVMKGLSAGTVTFSLAYNFSSSKFSVQCVYV